MGEDFSTSICYKEFSLVSQHVLRFHPPTENLAVFYNFVSSALNILQNVNLLYCAIQYQLGILMIHNKCFL